MCRCVACNKKIDLTPINSEDGKFLRFEDMCGSCLEASYLWEHEVEVTVNRQKIPDPVYKFSDKTYVGNQTVSENWLN